MRSAVFRLKAGSCILVAAFLASCATAYQPYSLTGGYKDQPVGLNRYYVEFYGNGNTTRDTVFAYWIYRCAELTLDKGFDYFVFISKTPPPGIEDQSNGSGSSEAVRARRGGSAPIYTYTPGYTITTWSGRGVIELRKGEPSEEELDQAMVAKEIIAALGPAVRDARASSGNVALPPSFALDRPRNKASASEPVKLNDLESLLPK